MICKQNSVTLLVGALLFLNACSDGKDSLSSKRIYSVLQSEEWNIRHSHEKRVYVLSQHVLGTNYSTVAFPLLKKEGSYIVFLANPRNDGQILSVPDEPQDFVLSRQTLEELSRKNFITKPLELHLSTMVR